MTVLSRFAAQRLGRRSTERALLRLAADAEALERRLDGLETDAAAGVTKAGVAEALCRLATTLDAAAARVRLLARRAAAESATFTERRSDEDWRATASAKSDAPLGRGVGEEKAVEGGMSGDWSEH